MVVVVAEAVVLALAVDELERPLLKVVADVVAVPDLEAVGSLENHELPRRIGLRERPKSFNERRWHRS